MKKVLLLSAILCLVSILSFTDGWKDSGDRSGQSTAQGGGLLASHGNQIHPPRIGALVT